MSDETNVLQVTEEILNYMRRFPNAADTEEHITHWWLNEGDLEQEPEVVSSALKILETNEFIERVELPDNRVVYRLRKII
jgi:hypothetical protein